MAGSVHILVFFSSCCMTCMLFCSIVLAEHSRNENPTPGSIGPGQSPVLTESSQTCDGFLTFTTQPPYNNLESIPLVLSSDESETNKTSPVTEYSTLESNSFHTIPIRCSSSGQCDQMNSSYIIGQGDTYNSTADVIYQWLTSCQVLIDQKGYNAYEDLRVGDTMPVPIRCACPTREQIYQKELVENKLSSNDSYKYPNIRVLLAPGESPSPDSGAGEPPSPDLGPGEPPADLEGGGSGQDPAVKAPMNEPTSPTSKSNNTWKYIVGTIGTLIFAVCAWGILAFKCKLCGKVEINIFRSTKKKKKELNQFSTLEQQSKAGPN
ncbi:hypothetical protein SAY86_032151 [Trapa natans]|uniref:LYK3/4/5 second LysM domain-containing protein n=1 Tax=Trapa natans TaxID=22666 RepID=A0AAN7M539_TRANT|nr:hypothetical protein SAY86_032151 [Trapa natans]